MSSVNNTDVCSACGEEFWYDVDLRTGEYTKISSCRCDRYVLFLEEFLKERSLLERAKEEFEKAELERAAGL